MTGKQSYMFPVDVSAAAVEELTREIMGDDDDLDYAFHVMEPQPRGDTIAVLLVPRGSPYLWTCGRHKVIFFLPLPLESLGGASCAIYLGQTLRLDWNSMLGMPQHRQDQSPSWPSGQVPCSG